MNAPEFQMVDYRPKVSDCLYRSLSATITGSFANLLHINNLFNLPPVNHLFNMGTFYTQSNDTRSGYVKLGYPGQQQEKNALYDYTIYGRTIVASLPDMPLGVVATAEPSTGCYDGRFRFGYTILQCQSGAASCMSVQHNPQ
jgi:hypothetical protein